MLHYQENTHREGVQSGLCASQLMQITGVKVHLASLWSSSFSLVSSLWSNIFKRYKVFFFSFHLILLSTDYISFKNRSLWNCFRLCAGRMSSLVNVHEQDITDTSLSSSGDQKPLVLKERSCFRVVLVVIPCLLLIWGVSLLPTVFYANKLPVPTDPPSPNIRLDFADNFLVLCLMWELIEIWFWFLTPNFLSGIAFMEISAPPNYS